MPVLDPDSPLFPDPTGEHPLHVRAIGQAVYDLENGVDRDVVTSVGRIEVPGFTPASSIMELMAESLPRPRPTARYLASAANSPDGRSVLVRAPEEDVPRRHATLAVIPKVMAGDYYGECAVVARNIVDWRKIRDSPEYMEARLVVLSSSLVWTHRDVFLGDPLVGGVRWSRLVVSEWEKILTDVPALDAEFTWLFSVDRVVSYKTRRKTEGLLISKLPPVLYGRGEDSSEFLSKIQISLDDALVQTGIVARPVEFVSLRVGLDWHETVNRVRAFQSSRRGDRDVVRQLVAEVDAGRIAATEGRREVLDAMAQTGFCLCPICMEDAPSGRCVALGCTHVMCAGCAVRAFDGARDGASCPTCRRQVDRVLVPDGEDPPTPRDKDSLVREVIARHEGDVMYCTTDRDDASFPCETHKLNGGDTCFRARLRDVSAVIYDAHASSQEDGGYFRLAVNKIFAGADAPTLKVYLIRKRGRASHPS